MSAVSRNILVFLTLVLLVVLWVVFVSEESSGTKDLAADDGKSSLGETSQLSQRNEVFPKLSSRIVVSEQFLDSDDEQVKKVIEIIQESERKRAKITFDSTIDGRRNIFFEISEPTGEELAELQVLVREVPGSLVTSEDGKEEWASFLTRKFYLNQPTACKVMIGESGGGTLFRYTISPAIEGRNLEKEYGDGRFQNSSE